MSKKFETVARWFDKFHYVETDDKPKEKTTNKSSKTGDFVTHGGWKEKR